MIQIYRPIAHHSHNPAIPTLHQYNLYHTTNRSKTFLSASIDSYRTTSATNYCHHTPIPILEPHHHNFALSYRSSKPMGCAPSRPLPPDRHYDRSSSASRRPFSSSAQNYPDPRPMSPDTRYASSPQSYDGGRYYARRESAHKPTPLPPIPVGTTETSFRRRSRISRTRMYG